jgi:hypothetical protein
MTLLQSPSSIVRKAVALRVSGVTKIVLVGNFTDLAKHSIAGQIADAQLSPTASGHVLRMQLAAGYIEIEAEAFSLEGKSIAQNP